MAATCREQDRQNFDAHETHHLVANRRLRTGQCK